ncbi:MAG TPA: hypothetical protein PKE69_24900, partial [Pyrinomonadaceae bacterium]|nr:hypothetical protein [Pyrinomonadaceae bacterium]
MKILKFGGSSVGNAENIEKTIAIIAKTIEKDSCAVVLSAMQSMTDKLIEIGKLAETGNENFIEKIIDLLDKHTETARQLFHGEEHEMLLFEIKQCVNEL